MSNPDNSKPEYTVVVNHEEQYALWLAQKPIPLGWKAVGVAGSKEKCLHYIEEVWTDMRPRSLRESQVVTEC